MLAQRQGFTRRIRVMLANALGALLPIRVEPRRLFSDGEVLRASLEAEGEAARSAGLDLARSMNSLSERGGWRLSILKQERELTQQFASGDPDGLAALLVDRFHLGELEPTAQQRTVGVLSAILAPAVMLCARAVEPMTQLMVRTELLDWVETGTTPSAQCCAGVRSLRAFARHPASIYDLICDASEQTGIDHGQMMETLVKPVILALFTFDGMLINLRSTVTEASSH